MNTKELNTELERFAKFARNIDYKTWEQMSWEERENLTITTSKIAELNIILKTTGKRVFKI